MASTSRRMVASVLFVVLLLVASDETGTMKVAEARVCVSQSHRFRGGCVSSSNCHHVCQTEGFQSGECRVHFVRRKCYCKKFC